MDAMVSLAASYKRSYTKGQVKFRGKVFNAAQNAGDDGMLVALSDFIKKGSGDQAKLLPGLLR